MKIRTLGLSLTVSLLAAWLSGCSSSELTISDAWIPEAPPDASALAGYMTIENSTDRIQTLVGATGELLERIDIHQTVYEKDSGLARMIRQDHVSIEPGRTFRFKPGGHHLMLINPKKAFKEGESVRLSLVFADDSRPTVDFEVRRDRLNL